MTIKISLQEMSYAEKLELFDALWDNLAQSEGEFPSPAWHKDLLDERRQLAAAGENPLIDWDIAQKQIDDQIAKERNK